VLRRATRARTLGALQPIATESVCLNDQGLRFVARVATNLARKRAERPRGAEDSPHNPFLPYEADLFVCDVTASHVCLFNKFNVVDNHLLVITRQYEHQEDLLTFADFEALWRCLSELEGLGFYNSGSDAGASQTHKHLQIVPFPLGIDGQPLPFTPVLDISQLNRPGRLSVLPFKHFIAPMTPTPENDPVVLAEKTQALYGLLLDAAGIAPIRLDRAVRASRPYNLLVTRDWVMLVPRSRERFETISINALAFTGSLFIRNREELQVLETSRPASVLKAVTAC
jgi:ATP adenylyltransferase